MTTIGQQIEKANREYERANQEERYIMKILAGMELYRTEKIYQFMQTLPKPVKPEYMKM